MRLWGFFQTGSNVGGTIHVGWGIGTESNEKRRKLPKAMHSSLSTFWSVMWASILLLHHPGTGCSYHYVFPNWELKLGGIFNLPSLNSIFQGSLSQPWEMLLMQAVFWERHLPESMSAWKGQGLFSHHTGILFSFLPRSHDFLHILTVKSQMSHLLYSLHTSPPLFWVDYSIPCERLVVDCCQYLFTFVFIPKLCN